jgi:hypothetical protein
MELTVKAVRFLTVNLMATLIAFEAAAAVSITNRDDKEHKITIIEGDSRKEHSLKPAAVMDGVCDKGCIVRLNDSDNDEYELEGNEVVSIEDGYLYYDGPDTPAAPSSGEPGKQGAPKQ